MNHINPKASAHYFKFPFANLVHGLPIEKVKSKGRADFADGKY